MSSEDLAFFPFFFLIVNVFFISVDIIRNLPSFFGKIAYRTVDWKKIIDFGYGRLIYEIAPVVNRSVGRI